MLQGAMAMDRACRPARGAPGTPNTVALELQRRARQLSVTDRVLLRGVSNSPEPARSLHQPHGLAESVRDLRVAQVRLAQARSAQTAAAQLARTTQQYATKNAESSAPLRTSALVNPVRRR